MWTTSKGDADPYILGMLFDRRAGRQFLASKFDEAAPSMTSVRMYSTCMVMITLLMVVVMEMKRRHFANPAFARADPTPENNIVEVDDDTTTGAVENRFARLGLDAADATRDRSIAGKTSVGYIDDGTRTVNAPTHLHSTVNDNKLCRATRRPPSDERD